MRYKRTVLLMVVLAFLAACATTGPVAKPLTMKQQANIWMSIFNSANADTLATMKNPASTQAQKNMALKKKDILVKIWPLLKAYVNVVDGTAKSADHATNDPAALSEFINELTALASGGI